MTPGNAEHEQAEDLADVAAAENPDPQTRRETLELHLQDEELSDEGERVEVSETDD